jgi:hypothetical protein
MSVSSVFPPLRCGAWLLGLCFSAVLASTAFAFPPAPPFTIHGVARDPYGWALKAVDQGTVVIKRSGTIIAQAPIDESRPGENFRAVLSMDSNSADPYRTGAQTPGVSFTVEVKFPSQTMLVSSLKASQLSIGQPGGDLFIDFTIGADTDGDGIPDAWEWWQLGEMGIGPGDPRYSLTTLGSGDFDKDGTSDYDEYLAGTFAFLAQESLSLSIEDLEADGTARLRTLLVVDKSYRVEFSTDLQTWTPASIRVGALTATLSTNFSIPDTRQVPLYAPVAGSPDQRFYRLVLVR